MRGHDICYYWNNHLFGENHLIYSSLIASVSRLPLQHHKDAKQPHTSPYHYPFLLYFFELKLWRKCLCWWDWTILKPTGVIVKNWEVSKLLSWHFRCINQTRKCYSSLHKCFQEHKRMVMSWNMESKLCTNFLDFSFVMSAFFLGNEFSGFIQYWMQQHSLRGENNYSFLSVVCWFRSNELAWNNIHNNIPNSLDWFKIYTLWLSWLWLSAPTTTLHHERLCNQVLHKLHTCFHAYSRFHSRRKCLNAPQNTCT